LKNINIPKVDGKFLFTRQMKGLGCIPLALATALPIVGIISIAVSVSRKKKKKVKS
jgi:hypothetical protein